MALPVRWISEILAPIIRPGVRFVVGLIAIPTLRWVIAKWNPEKEWDEEFERDLEQWVRASLLLLLASKNVEMAITSAFLVRHPEMSLDNWWFLAGRLLLAIGVIEAMPDQQLFGLIHTGPKRPKWNRDETRMQNFRREAKQIGLGLGCLHLSRSSPVFAILSVIFDGTAGWVFLVLAAIQYLIIALVTSRESAISKLIEFDTVVAEHRKNILRHAHLPEDLPNLAVPTDDEDEDLEPQDQDSIQIHALTAPEAVNRSQKS